MPPVLKILLPCLLLFNGAIYAQNDWPSPELEQMYHHAQDYVNIGNYKDAITTYRQAILLAPGKFALQKGLGTALYLTGDFGNTIKTLIPLIDLKEAEEQCFLLLAKSEIAIGDTKAARTTLRKGLQRFSSSGSLYHESGSLYALDRKHRAALDEWMHGISVDPNYSTNYYDAALACLTTRNVMRGLLLAEIFLNIAPDTTKEQEVKKMLFTGYKTMFDNIVQKAIKATTYTGGKPGISFEEAVEEIYRSLTPVISDGITTENLTMVRTRFLMDWHAKYAGVYPFSLFTYQDYLLRNGLFDMYNEWLFGKAESITEYNAWTQFHPVETNLFLEKQKEHPLHPTSTDFYYSRLKQRKNSD